MTSAFISLQSLVSTLWTGEALQKLELQKGQRNVELDTLNPVEVFGYAFVVLGYSLIFWSVDSQDSLEANRAFEDNPAVLATPVVAVVEFFVTIGH